LLFTLSRFVNKPLFRLPSAAGPFIATSISCITYNFPHLTQFCYHEHGGKRFLRNADKHLSGYRLSHLRLLHSSYSISTVRIWNLIIYTKNVRSRRKNVRRVFYPPPLV
jgi:hypothetical protein